MCFKYLISCFLLLSNGDGWFSVEKVPKTKEVVDFIDANIWVLFSKKMETGLMQVRFPGEPQYKYLENGDFLVWSKVENSVLSLLVTKEQGHLLEKEDQQWVQEHTLLQNGQFFQFKITSKVPQNALFQNFISSFSLVEI